MGGVPLISSAHLHVLRVRMGVWRIVCASYVQVGRRQRLIATHSLLYKRANPPYLAYRGTGYRPHPKKVGARIKEIDPYGQAAFKYARMKTSFRVFRVSISLDSVRRPGTTRTARRAHIGALNACGEPKKSN